MGTKMERIKKKAYFLIKSKIVNFLAGCETTSPQIKEQKQKRSRISFKYGQVTFHVISQGHVYSLREIFFEGISFT